MVIGGVISVENDEVYVTLVKGIEPGVHSPIVDRLLTSITTICIVISQDMITRLLELIPDLQKIQILFFRHAEITQLNDKVDLLTAHVIYETPQSIVSIVHYVFVNISDDAEAERLYRFRLPNRATQSVKLAFKLFF